MRPNFTIAGALALVTLALVPVALPEGVARAAPDGGAVNAPARVESLRVAVSAELASTFLDLGAAYTQFGGPTVTVAAGAPGDLVDKEGKGATFDVLGGGSRTFATGRVPGVCSAASELRYARGQLAVWTRSGTPPTAAQLVDARWKKIALAEPNLAPYGRAAGQALEQAGVLTALMPRLVYRPDGASALALARDGTVDAAVVALSLVVEEHGRYTLIDPQLYSPVDETLMACGKDPARLAAARAFEAFATSPRAAPILKKHALAPLTH